MAPTPSMTVLRSGETAQSDILVIYAPGAGSNIGDPFGVFLSETLAGEQTECWRFEFPYMAAKRGAPDRLAVLEGAWQGVIEQAKRETGKRIVACGRSMGGRIASQVLAHGTAAAGLVLLAYPLHPPGRPDKPRSGHLPLLTVPTLFCSGTRDPYGTPEELKAAAALVRNAQVHFLEGADHGFAVLKASGERERPFGAMRSQPCGSSSPLSRAAALGGSSGRRTFT